MDKQDLGQRIIALTPTLYRVSCGLLRNEADREDAVQSAIERAWRKAASLRDADRLKPWLVRILIKNVRHSRRAYPQIAQINKPIYHNSISFPLPQGKVLSSHSHDSLLASYCKEYQRICYISTIHAFTPSSKPTKR